MNALPTPHGVLSIIRMRHREPADWIPAALEAGGVGFVEVTLPTPGAERTIERWRHAGHTVGAGTIRTTGDVVRAHNAGALFLVTPTLSMPVLAAARGFGLPVLCGAATPTEIDRAWQAGAAAVKVFPIDQLGGPDFIRAVAAPLDDVPFAPTGGISPDEAREYAAIDCVAVGVGSELVAELTSATDTAAELERRAAEFTRAWNEGVAERARRRHPG